MVTTATGTREATTTATRPQRGVGVDGRLPRGGGGSPGPNGKGPGGGGGKGRDGGWSPDRYRIGIKLALASIMMMFTALASTYVVRSGLPGPVEWRVSDVPPFVWLSTALILVSSVTVGRARRLLSRDRWSSYRRWMMLTLVLGLGFLASQLMAWRQLVARGVYLNTNPHSSFFYVLTGLHGLHLAGGILGLSYVIFRAPLAQAALGAPAARRKQQALTDAAATYWHFMDGLWVFLFLLLFLWR